MPIPVSWSDRFGREAPLEIEVGSGKGLFLHQASGDQPEHDFVGIEISAKYARFAAARLAKSQRTNACILHGDANKLFREHLTDSSLEAVHVYFPDPWWKDRHIKRRIMNPTFLQLVQKKLRAGGSLHFWTDVEEYFRLSLQVIDESTDLVGPIDVAERAAEHDMDYHTHFERRTRLNEQPVYRSRFEKQH